MKEFVTAAKQVAEQADGGDGSIEFNLDGFMAKCYQPNDGQVAVLMATTSRHSSTQEQIAGIINFFASVLDAESHTHIVSRLLDRTDPFGIEQVQNIIEWMIEEWTGRPTKLPSGSTQSPPSGGQNLMVTTTP